MYWSSKAVFDKNLSDDNIFVERFALAKTSSNLIKPNSKAAGPALIFRENIGVECKERLGHWQPFRSIFSSQVHQPIERKDWTYSSAWQAQAVIQKIVN
jgi:hypothetical protein